MRSTQRKQFAARRRADFEAERGPIHEEPAWKQEQGPSEQLPMFMQAKDVVANYDPMHGDRRTSPRATGGEDVDSVDMTWKRKLSISKDAPEILPQSHYDAIAEHGVKNPIHLSVQFGPHGASTGPWPSAPRGDRREVLGGHHSIAAQNDINPNAWVPVLHHENFQEIEHHIQNVQGRRGVAEGWKYR